MMDRISSGFDWVVIDSPPVLPLADTSMWMRLADAILLVMRPGVTSKKQLQRSFEAIEQSKLIGSVLNASSETLRQPLLLTTTSARYGRPAVAERNRKITSPFCRLNSSHYGCAIDDI